MPYNPLIDMEKCLERYYPKAAIGQLQDELELTPTEKDGLYALMKLRLLVIVVGVIVDQAISAAGSVLI
jgi:hypothetical protein